ncbi:MAG: DEAD/DEAH box helicase [Rhodocyclaceae bacterium]|nr:DEAD/DEAH box helicase [Rhodocyclaceae bacterium]
MTDLPDSFAALGLPPALLSALAEVGYETPSPIQAACIPHLLEGQDLLGEAQTGTGKTAAFALPLLARIDLARPEPQALVLVPTRELAIQVSEAFQKYAHHMAGFHVLPIYGGQSMVVQLRALSRGPQVIVGTPGRIMDHLERKSLVLEGLASLVLDEADEMLRMGFIDDVEWILEHTPAGRQTALFSATMPEPIRRVARRHLREPREVKIRAATATVAAIRQRYWQVRGADKLEALTRILEVEEEFDAGIVFVRTKTATVELAERLEARGYEAAALNGDMTQGLREQVIERLKGGSLDLVVATDVAARGIDVPRVSHVINYDVPYDTEAYVHRIGRTGRAGRAGNAILFVAPREMRILRAIERATRQPIEPIALPTRAQVAGRRVALFKQQVVEILDSEPLDFFHDIVRQLQAEQEVGARDVAAALAWLATRDRPLQPDGADGPAVPAAAPAAAPSASASEPAAPAAPATYARPARAPAPAPAARPRIGLPRAEERETAALPPPAEAKAGPAKATHFMAAPPRGDHPPVAMERYRIEVGRQHGVMPKEIVGAIANEGGIDGRYIGQIHLLDDHSTVELPVGMPAEILETLKRTRVRQVPLRIRLLTAAEAEVPGRPRWKGDAARTGGKFAGAGKGAPRWEHDTRPAKYGEKPARPARHDDKAGKPARSGEKPARAARFGDTAATGKAGGASRAAQRGAATDHPAKPGYRGGKAKPAFPASRAKPRKT